MRKIAYVVGSLVLTGCGGGGGESPSPVASNTPVSAASVAVSQPYFTEVLGAFPNPTSHFWFFNQNQPPQNNLRTNIGSGKLNAVFSVDLNNDGNKEVVMVIYKGYGHDNMGSYAIENCKTTTVIYTLVGERFVDVSDSYLEKERDFKACIGDDYTSVVDVNGDNKPDMFFSPNQEDGRNPQLGSQMNSQLVGWISQPNGKYKVTHFGPSKWYHSIGSGVDQSGNIFITGNGHNNNIDPNNLRYIWNGREMQTIYDQYFPEISPHKFIFLSKNGKSSDTLIQHYANSTIEMGAIGYYQENSIWYKTNTIAPEVKQVGEENFQVWSGDTRKVKVIDVEGYKAVGWGGGSNLNGLCEFRLYKDEKPTVLGIYNIASIPNYVPGTLIKESEVVPINFWGVLDVKDKKLTYQKLEIIGESRFGPGRMQCVDINKDGYDDVVVGLGNDDSIRHKRIYINQKNGTLKKLDLGSDGEMKLNETVDLYMSWLDDFDNDGLMDIIVYPANHVSNTSFEGTLKYYRGTRKIQ
jgi:hypothetical protein